MSGTEVLYISKNCEPREFRTRAITELHDILTKQVASAERLTREIARIVTPVFHELDGSPVNVKRFYRAWQVACEAAGYPGSHPFRRTVARDLIRAGVPERPATRRQLERSRAFGLLRPRGFFWPGDARDELCRVSGLAPLKHLYQERRRRNE